MSSDIQVKAAKGSALIGCLMGLPVPDENRAGPNRFWHVYMPNADETTDGLLRELVSVAWHCHTAMPDSRSAPLVPLGPPTARDRTSAKAAPVGCQLATTALRIKTATIPKRWVVRKKLPPNLGRQPVHLG